MVGQGRETQGIEAIPCARPALGRGRDRHRDAVPGGSVEDEVRWDCGPGHEPPVPSTVFHRSEYVVLG